MNFRMTPEQFEAHQRMHSRTVKLQEKHSPPGRPKGVKEKASRKSKPPAKGVDPIVRVATTSKHRAVPCEVNGKRFASQKEGRRYRDLLVLERAGQIRALECHPKYRLTVNDVDCGFYEADFRYINNNGTVIVSDVKSRWTRKLPVYRLKRRLMHAIYGIEITEE